MPASFLFPIWVRAMMKLIVVIEMLAREIQKEPLFTKDGGHGMLFRTPEGELRLALHSPNTHLAERPHFIPVTL